MSTIYLSPYINLIGLGNPSYDDGVGYGQIWGRCILGRPYKQYGDEFCHVAWCRNEWIGCGKFKTKDAAYRAMDKLVIEVYNDDELVFLTREQWNKMQVLI